MTLSPDFVKLLQDTSTKKIDDLRLTEVSQKVYEEAYEFLLKKYGQPFGRTNLMLNGHLITPKLEEAFRAKTALLLQQEKDVAKLVQE